jgi:hypothetical protein
VNTHYTPSSASQGKTILELSRMSRTGEEYFRQKDKHNFLLLCRKGANGGIYNTSYNTSYLNSPSLFSPLFLILPFLE